MAIPPIDNSCLNKLLHQWLQKDDFVVLIMYFSPNILLKKKLIHLPPFSLFLGGGWFSLFNGFKSIVTRLFWHLNPSKLDSRSLSMPPSVFMNFFAFWYINSPCIFSHPNFHQFFSKEISFFYWKMILGIKNCLILWHTGEIILMCSLHLSFTCYPSFLMFCSI